MVYNRDVIIRRMQSEINELKARPTGIIPNQPLMYSWKPPTKGVTKATLVVLGILLFTASETMSYKEIYDKYVEERSNPFSPHYNPSKKPRESMFCETAQSSLINIYINNIRKYLRDYNITVQQKKVDGVRRYKLHEIDKLKLLELGGLPPKITLDLIKFNTPTEKAVNHDFKEAA